LRANQPTDSIALANPIALSETEKSFALVGTYGHPSPSAAAVAPGRAFFLEVYCPFCNLRGFELTQYYDQLNA